VIISLVLKAVVSNVQVHLPPANASNATTTISSIIVALAAHNPLIILNAHVLATIMIHRHPHAKNVQKLLSAPPAQAFVLTTLSSHRLA
jgi:hypothetical protein